jgi:hypothetical protein
MGEIGSAEEALTYSEIVEAEGATGGGTAVSDASASGGAFLRNTVIGSMPSVAFTTTGSIQSGVIRARTSAGCAAMVTITVDTTNAGSAWVSPAGWTDYPITFTGAPGPHTIYLHYRQGTAGCPLDIDEATFTIFEPDPPPPPPPTTTTSIESELASGAGAIQSDASASGGQARVFSASYTSAVQSFTIPDPSTGGSVRVRGGSCAPMGRVRIDGVEVWAGTVTSSTWVELPIGGPSFAAGSHSLELYARQASAACPIRFDVVKIVSSPPPPPPPPPITTIIEAETATGAGSIVRDATASGGQMLQFSASYQSRSVPFTTTGALQSGSVRVRGNGCAALGYLYVDGVAVWSGYVSQSTWTDAPITGSVPAGDHTLQFYARSVSASCPLRFDRVTLVTAAP